MYKLNNKTIRESEDKFYKYLRKIEKLVKDCDTMEILTNDEETFGFAFPSIVGFLNEVRPEYEGSFLEGAKVIEKEFISARVKKKFNKISKLIQDKVINDKCFIL